MNSSYPLWDSPVRIIHWAIALMIPASWWTAEEGYMEVHQYLGLGVLTLVITRLVWGLIGSPQARFSDFVRGPSAVLAHLKGTPAATPGHNPLGGWSVLLLWTLLVAQVVTGSVSTDDVLFDGPFRHAIDSSLADKLAELHETLFNVLVAFVALHVLTVLFYEFLKDQRLLMPMIKGRSEGREGTGPARGWYWALIVVAVVAGLLWGAVEMAPPPPASSYW